MTRPAPLIAIVGRPNVGKSTLYNRLVGGRPALVHDTPGLTRDRRYGEFDYFGRWFRVVDTGGLDPEAEKDVIGAGIHRQAQMAIQESDAVLFVVDARAGVTALDHEVADMLRKVDRPLFVCANKVDSAKREGLSHEFFELGLGPVFPISAAHGRGVDELLDALALRLELPPPAVEEAEDETEGEPEGEPEGEIDSETDGEPDDDHARDQEERDGEDSEEEGHEPGPRGESEPLRVTLVGKPNAGKSSLLNRLIGVERALVHHQPGTTTDPVDTEFEYGGRPYVLVDTAGIRRRSRIDAETEKLAVSLALAQIKRADVVVLVIDVDVGSTEQDARLAGAIEESGRALVVALNKIDTLAGPAELREVEKKVREELHFLSYAPFVRISALRGDGMGELMAAINRVAVQHRRRISTAELNRFFAEVCEKHPPPLWRGLTVRVHYMTQGGVKPPTFLLWANRPGGLSPGYRRYVQNQLRSRYRFEGSPLRLVVKAKQQKKRRR